MLGKCKNCKFWDEGTCLGQGMHDAGFGWRQDPAIAFKVEATANDDSGLEAVLITGPEFGCVRFEERQSSE